MSAHTDSNYPDALVVSRTEGLDFGGGENSASASEPTVELTEAQQNDFEEAGRQRIAAYTAIRDLHEAITHPIKKIDGVDGDRHDPAPADQPLNAADTPNLGRFEIREHLGSGGSGLVFRAFDPQLQREVALKIPRADVVFTEGSRERFFREARLVAALDHPNIIPVHEAGTVGSVRYMACGYCAGPSLAEWLQARVNGNQPVFPRLAARWVEMLAEAVQFAHQRGIIHRDLKPSNILLEPKPRTAADEADLKTRDVPDFIPRISDFGIGKIVEGDVSMTASGAIIGTPQYMSPEQAAGAEAGPLADVYGLGVILYEILSGQPPFQGAATLEVLERVREDDPVPPRLLNSRVPEDLQTICLKCLEKSPGRRYATAQHVADDLRRFLEDRPILARKTGVARRVLKWARRRPTSAALVLVLAVATLLASAAGWWHSVQLQSALDVSNKMRAEADRERTDAETARAQVEDRERSLRRQIAPSKILLADESARMGDTKRASELLSEVVQSTGSEFTKDFTWRYASGLCREHEHEFAPGGGEVYMVAFSPDGKTLAVGSQNGTVKLWDPVSGAEQGELRGHTSCLNTMIFFDQGRQLLTGGCDKSVRLWDMASRRQTSVVWQGESNIHALAISPDGARAAAGDDKGIRLWQLNPLKELSYADSGTSWPKSALSFVGSSNLLVSNGGPEDRFQFWEVDGSSARPTSPRLVASTHFRQIAVSPDGKLLAYGEDIGAIRLIDTGTWREVGQLPIRWSDVRALAFSNDGRMLASAGEDKIIRVWDVAARRVLTSMTGHQGRVCSLAFSPDGKKVASASWDGTARTWRVERRVGRRLIPSTGTTGEISFSSDGTQLVSQNGGASLAVWDVRTWTKTAKISGHRFSVGSVPGPPESGGGQVPVIAVATGSRVEIWSGDGARRLADFDGEVTRPENNGEGHVTIISMSADALALITAGFGRTAVRDVTLAVREGRGLAGREPSGTVVPTDGMYTAPARFWIPEQLAGTSCVALSPDASLAAIVRAHEALIMLWDVSRFANGSELLEGHQRDLSAIPAGGRVPTDSTELKGHPSSVIAAVFSPDGRMLATSSKDGSIRTWNTTTKETLHTLIGHTAGASAIAFSPDSRNLASAGEDGYVRVWDMRTGHESLRLGDHESPVRGITFSPDGKMLVTASPGPEGHGELILWYADVASTIPIPDGVASSADP